MTKHIPTVRASALRVNDPLSLQELLPFATTIEAKYIETVIAQGTQRKAAITLGKAKTTIQAAIKRTRLRAAKRGMAPELGLTHPVPEGFQAETSTLRGPDGGIKLQWTKSRQDREQFMESMIACAEAMSEDIPKALPVEAPEMVDEDLLNLYVITDYHMGMKADSQETRTEGGDWDMHIAEDLLVRWFGQAIKYSPDSKVAVFAQLGDFLHWDGLDAITPTSGHILDADDRFQKLVHVSIRVLRRVTEMLLQKHEHVYIIMAEGNHDLSGSVWLREMFAALYDNEPRITVDLNPDPYYCHEFGQNTLFFHHGHKKRVHNVDDIFVAKFRAEYGRTKFSHAHMGHLHHERVLETNLMTVEQHQTLASKDSYAARGGWMANRCARAITYHKEFGKVTEFSISPEMLKAW